MGKHCLNARYGAKTIICKECSLFKYFLHENELCGSYGDPKPRNNFDCLGYGLFSLLFSQSII